MSSPRDPMEPRASPARSFRSRPGLRLHHIYYLLAAFDLVAVSLGLFVIKRATDIYAASVAVNQQWAARLDAYSDLAGLAAAVNAPGNDLFYSRDVESESRRLEEAVRRFREMSDLVRADLAGNVAEPQRRELLEAFDAVPREIDTMIAEARLIFSHFRAGESQRAGERMAHMDQDYARVNAALADLGGLVRSIQHAQLDAQNESVASLRTLEYAIAGLIVAMVCGVTVYGQVLARRMRRADRQREADLGALAESESRLQAILDATTAVVYVKDAEGRYLLINRRFEELFHVDRKRVLGRSDYDLFPAENAASFRANDHEVLRRASAVQFEEVAPHDDGPHTYVSVKFPLFDGSGRAYATCGISTDITERKRAEEELARHRDHLEEAVAQRSAELEASHEQLRLAERLASIGTLAAGLGHDMNNMLFPVRCRLDVLEWARLETPARAELADVRRSVEYLQQLADGLRLLSLDPEDPLAAAGVTRLAEWAPQVRPLFRTALPRRADLRFELPEGLPPIAVAPHRLAQAVFNLVLNAGEAIREGGSVRVWAEAHEDRRFVRLGVTDDGAGMSPEVRRRALEPFFTTKKRGLSTGLGLALVHGVTNAAGGTVEIDSIPGRGTTVKLTLPVAAAADSLDPAAPAHHRRAAISVADVRVAAILAAVLESEGFEAQPADGAAPGSATLWVTDPGSERLEAARRFVRGEPLRRVVVVGPAPPEWAALGARVIEPEAGLDAIRRAVRTSAAAGAVP